MMKTLVTAFKPFNNKSNNYALEVLNYILGVDKLIIDVVYDECYNEIINQVKIEEYDLIIALGEARMRNELTLELNAKNIADCSLPDNLGQIKKNKKIIENEIEYIETLVNVNNLKDLIKFSTDAGKFVCNNLYFHLLIHCQNKALFIHIPECNDNIENYQKHAKTIEQIIQTIGGQ